MSAPLASKLDGNQVLQGSFDETTGRLRVETAATIVNGAVEVAIDASTDSIAIKDPSSGNVLAIQPDGSIKVDASFTGPNDVTITQGGNDAIVSNGALNVNVVSTTPSVPTETLSIFEEITNVAMGSSQTILSYTVPGGVDLYLNKILVSSDSVSYIELQLDGQVNARKRLSYVLFNETFDYSLNGEIGGYKISSGTIVTLVGTNVSTGGPADFNATLQGVQQ